MRLYYLCMLLMIVGITSCDRSAVKKNQSGQSQNEVLMTKENQKYNSSCVFYGEKSGDNAAGERGVIKYVAIRDNATGKEANYVPPDSESIQSSQGYFTDVWSPDEEYLVLPLGRFKGFCLIKSSDAVGAIQKKECSDNVRVYDDTGTGLWHEFEKWASDESFVFKAGLSGNDFELQYDIGNQRLIPLYSGKHFIEGENKNGKIKLSKD